MPGMPRLPHGARRAACALCLALAARAAAAAIYNVTNLADAGGGSLRDALVAANGNGGADVVTFQAGLAGTITLGSPLSITDSVDIQGPGSGVITISGNDAVRVLAASLATSGTVVVGGLSIVHGRPATGNGGGLAWSAPAGSSLTVHDAVFNWDVAEGGGGGAIATSGGGTITLDNVILDNNGCLGPGGGLAADFSDGGSVFITGSVIVNNDSGVIGNNTTGPGGGLYFQALSADGPVNVTIDTSTISANGSRGGLGGGGFYADGVDSFVLRGSTVDGNSSIGDSASFSNYGGGGGILVSTDGAIENSTVSGNTTNGDGGGLWVAQGVALVRHSTFSGNHATLFGENILALGAGGGVGVYDSIVANGASGQDAISKNSGRIDLVNSLVELVTVDGIDIRDLGGNIFNQDPQLGPLQANGGPTLTLKPASSSPAVNAADPAFAPPPATDQRGLSRVSGGRLDMGAVELQAGTVQFAAASASVAEDGGSILITVTRSGGSEGAASVGVAVNAASTATGGGVDYTLAPPILSWAEGDAANETFSIAIQDDAFFEGDETIELDLTNPTGAGLGAPATMTVTILDREPGTVQFALASANVTEDGGSIDVTVTRTSGSAGAASVAVTANVASTASGGGVDYSLAPTVLSWGDGDAADRTFSIAIQDDALVEGDETIALDLANPLGAGLGAPSAMVITVLDREPGILVLQETAASVSEDSGSITFTVLRQGGDVGAVGVDLLTQNLEAFAPGDYQAVLAHFDWPNGDTTPRVFTAVIVDDVTDEPAERFRALLAAPAGGALLGAASEEIVTIVDDEAATVEVPALDWRGLALYAALLALAGLALAARR